MRRFPPSGNWVKPYTMTMDQAPGRRPTRLHRLAVILGWSIAIVVALVVYIPTAYPEPSGPEYKVIRIVVAAAAAFNALVVAIFLDYWPRSSKVAVIVGAAALLFAGAYLASPAQYVLLAPDQHLTIFTVCRGEYPDGCGPVTVHVGCGDPNTVVNDRCVGGLKSSTQISSRDGNRCGYTVWQFTCRARVK
jgi:hypothetical protein